jgi:hypothetical protein
LSPPRSAFDFIGIAWRHSDRIMAALPHLIRGVEEGSKAIPHLQEAWDILGPVLAEFKAEGVDLPTARVVSQRTAERVATGTLRPDEQAIYDREKWWAS